MSPSPGVKKSERVVRVSSIPANDYSPEGLAHSIAVCAAQFLNHPQAMRIQHKGDATVVATALCERVGPTNEKDCGGNRENWD